MNGFHDFEAFLGIKLYFKIYKHSVQKKYTSSDLKVLSIEMDLAVSSVVRHIFIKAWNEEIFSKFTPPYTVGESPSKILSHFEQLLAIRNAIANSGQKYDCAI